MMDAIANRRKRGLKIGAHHIRKMHHIAKAGMDEGLDVENASVDNYNSDQGPSISVRFRSRSRGGKGQPMPNHKMPMGETDGD